MTDEDKHESADAVPGDDGSSLEANFLNFISGLAAQTLMHLGSMTNPLTGKRETDLVNAKYSIDLLALLKEKTQGNLDDEEEQYLQAALTNLRMQYVQATKADDGTASDADA